MIKKLVTKRKGQGDLIASLFVILALTLFVFYYIGSIGDVGTKIQLDSIARKYILRMESAGELSTTDEAALKSDLMKISAVKEAVDMGNSINITWNGDNTAKGYGSTITLLIKCPAVITNYSKGSNTGTGNTGDNFGSVNRKEVITFVVTKQSTAKY